MSGAVVYVIQARNGAIKIGHSSNLKKRLETVRTHSPLPVRYIAILGNGGMPEELAYHRRFERSRSHCEWFIGPEVDAFVAQVMGQGLDQIEDWSELEFIGREGRRERRKRLLRAIWEDPERRISAARSQVDSRVWREFHHLLKTHEFGEVKAMAAAECARRRPDLFPTPTASEAA